MQRIRLGRGDKKIYILVLILMAEVFTMIIIGQNKQGFFMVEISTYGLANSFYEPFNNWTPEYYNQWNSSEYYFSYVETHDETQFRYDSVYYNQSQDVHPPLYYYLLHTICSFFPNQFSKWFGIGLNIACYLVVNILIYCTSRRYFKEEWMSYIPVLFYGFSIAAASTVMLIRMYMLMTMFAMLLLYVHTAYIFKEEILSRKALALCVITTWLGASTQYFFSYIAFFFAAFTCIFLIIKKQYKNMIKYGLSMLGGIISLFITFPPSYNHVFSGYRGVETIHNLTSLTSKGENLKEYVYVILNQLFVGMCTNLPAVTIAILILVVIVVACKLIYDSKNYMMGILLLTTICYFLMIVFGVSGVVSRHLYPIYPFIAILTVWIIISLITRLREFKSLKVIMSIFCIVLSFIGYTTKEIEWLYSNGDYATFVAQYNHEIPAIYLADLGFESSSNYFELAQYDSSAVVKYGDESIIGNLLNAKGNPNQFILYVLNDQKGMASVSEIASSNGYTQYKKLNAYNGSVCYLVSK